MRVALLLQSYRPVLGGAQRQVEQLTPLLAAQGVESRVFTRAVPGAPRREEGPGGVVERLLVPSSRGGASLAYTAQAARSARAWRPDLIHAFDLHSPALAALLAAAGTKVPLVAKVLSTGTGGDVDRLLQKPLGKQRLAWIARRFAAFQTLSDEVEAELKQAGVAPERLCRIPNGVDIAHFAPATPQVQAQARAELGLTTQEPIALYCGRFAPVKRLHVLLDAFALAPGHLALLGDGPERESVIARLNEPGLAGRVTLLEPRDDPAVAYRAADVYVSASLTEGMSGSMLEAMASGLAVLAAPASGVADQLRGDAGVIARGDLAPALTMLLADSAARAGYGQRSRAAAAERYSLARTAQLLLQMYGAVT